MLRGLIQLLFMLSFCIVTSIAMLGVMLSDNKVLAGEILFGAITVVILTFSIAIANWPDKK